MYNFFLSISLFIIPILCFSRCTSALTYNDPGGGQGGEHALHQRPGAPLPPGVGLVELRVPHHRHPRVEQVQVTRLPVVPRVVDLKEGDCKTSVKKSAGGVAL